MEKLDKLPFALPHPERANSWFTEPQLPTLVFQSEVPQPTRLSCSACKWRNLPISPRICPFIPTLIRVKVLVSVQFRVAWINCLFVRLMESCTIAILPCCRPQIVNCNMMVLERRFLTMLMRISALYIFVFLDSESMVRLLRWNLSVTQHCHDVRISGTLTFPFTLSQWQESIV